MSKATLVTGIFKSRLAAEAAVDTIMKQGYTRDEISVLTSDATRTKEFALQTKSQAAGGAGIGGAVGGVVGGSILAALVAVGTTIAFPPWSGYRRTACRCAGWCGGRRRRRRNNRRADWCWYP